MLHQWYPYWYSCLCREFTYIKKHIHHDDIHHPPLFINVYLHGLPIPHLCWRSPPGLLRATGGLRQMRHAKSRAAASLGAFSAVGEVWWIDVELSPIVMGIVRFIWVDLGDNMINIWLIWDEVSWNRGWGLPKIGLNGFEVTETLW